MTKFDAKVAYRILKAKQERLSDRNYELIREMHTLEAQGMLSPLQHIWRSREIRSYDQQVEGMWDVLVYLWKRIREEEAE